MTDHGLPQLDSIFHQPVRARLVLLLSQGPQSFAELKSKLNVTDGNLDAHLRKLSSAGYLHSQMVLHGRRRTIYQLSESGTVAFAKYVLALKRFIDLSCDQGA